METNRLKEIYLAKGYADIYFDYFKDFFDKEYDWDEDEQKALVKSYDFMVILNEQIALGHGIIWANQYALNHMYKDVFDIEDDSLVAELLEDSENLRKELEIFVKEFQEDEIFEYAYIESWLHDTLAAENFPCEFPKSAYLFAKEYSCRYHELIQAGYSDYYAKGWLYAQQIECDADAYAAAIEEASNAGMDYYGALTFADKKVLK